MNNSRNQQGRVAGAFWLRAYRRDWIRADIIAGMIAAAVVIPKAMAYATIAGLPVQVGLYTAFVPMVIYALLGTSRPLSVSTTTTIAILTSAELAKVAPNAGPQELLSAGATLAMLVGTMLLLASFLRLGFIANFISDPVLAGFKSGIGLVIVVDQLPKLLGFHIEKTGFFRDIVSIVQHLSQTSPVTLALAVVMLALLFGFEKFVPRAPAPLIAVAVGIGATAVLGLRAWGVETVGVVPRGLPSLVWPKLSLLEEMWPGAAGIALMSFTETIAAARAFAVSGEPRPIPNRELFATGLANVGGGLLGAMPAGGGTTQTAVNRSVGAKSQMAELVTAALALATLLLLAPVIGLMPNATLAAVVVVYSMGLINLDEFRQIAQVRKTEFYWAVLAFAGVAVLGTLRGILVAVVTSLLSLAQQAYSPPLYVVGRKPGTNVFRRLSPEHPEDETWPGLAIVRVEGRIFFANAQNIADRILGLVGQAKPSVIILDGSAIIDLEYTALKMLEEGEEKLRHEGVELWITALNPNVLATVRRSELGRRLGRERMFFTLQLAVERYQQTKAGGRKLIQIPVRMPREVSS